MLNPLPFQVGGEPTPASKAYALIRSAVGIGGSARADSGIEGLWRESRAIGLAAANSAYDRAILQLDPSLATDFLPYYERVTGLVPSPEDAPSTRAERAAERWTRSIDATTPNLAAELTKIDARLSLLAVNHDTAACTQFGRTIAPHDPTAEGAIFGGLEYAAYPNYSTNFVVRVRFAVGHSGQLTAEEMRIRERVRAFLCDVLPSWVDFTIGTGAWHLGSTPLGMGALG